MLFAAPWMLLGLVGLMVPIVIHMVARARTATVEWPTLRFLQFAQRQSAQRSRLKHLLVLIARLMLLALLVLAMAKPYQQVEKWLKPTDAPTTLVIAIDNSYSMGYRERDSSRTRFEQAQELAHQWIDELGLDDEVALVVANETVALKTQRPTRNHQRVVDLVRQAKLSSAGTDHTTALTTAFTLAQLDAVDETKPPNDDADADPIVREPRRAFRQVLLITDMQNRGWKRLIREQFLDKIEYPTHLTVANVAVERSSNRYVRRVRVDEQSAADQLRVEVEIGRYREGSTPLPSSHLTLWVDEKPWGSPEPIASRTRQVIVTGPMPAPGVHVFKVRLEKDRLPLDDFASFVIDVPKANRITVVSDETTSLRHLSEVHFLDIALKVRSSTRSEGLIDHLTPEQLSSAPIEHNGGLILANVPRLDGLALSRIERFLHRGGRVWVALGDRIEIEHYNRDWPFLPIRLDRPLGDPGRSRSYGFLVEQPDHPVFHGELDLSPVRFFAFIGSDPTTLRSGGRILATFSNGSPGLMEGTFGHTEHADKIGRVLLFTSSIDADWSNLPFRRIFVPLVDRIVTYLTKRQLISRSIAMGQPVQFIGPRVLEDKSLVVTAPDGTQQTLVAAAEEGRDEAMATYINTNEIGVYQVKGDPRFSSAGSFAVNLDVQESNLAQVDSERIETLFTDHPIRFIGPGRGRSLDWLRRSQQELTEERREYWPWLLIAALVIFAAETLLANVFTRRGTRTPIATTEYLATRRTDRLMSDRVA